MEKFFKKGMTLVAGLTMAGMLAACGSSDSSEEQASGESGGGGEEETYNIRFTHVVAEDHASHLALTEFAENVEEASDGRITMEVFPNGQLYGSDREAVEAVQMGNVEMTMVATPTMAGFNDQFMVFDLPFLFDSIEEARETVDGGLGDALNEKLEPLGMVGMGYGENGFRHYTNNRGPIEEPSDLEGLKLRVIESQIYQDMYNELGANASPLAFSELYSALQQGTYDAMENPVSLIYSMKFYEVQDYLTMTHQTYSPVITVMNKDFLDSMPEELQNILKEEAKKAHEIQRQYAQEQDTGYLEELEAEGMQINELSPEQEEKFKEKLQPVYDKYAEKLEEDILAQVQ